ncbi:NLI interacting factor-like phosphatase family protein [Trichomonas vaginalis G3]|uniref:NLI interacting factor-like phosphatase family protein n=1 Tax=Trichomonas vaginalis (strain ATCC PRA-98 / G3) TaxID=412133 RepID=A2FJD8_TRIV3|nr:phosphoprotein phosphatase protein [Trichomonas vaginalis G3]EAX94999.1 NLI interacting factor-like phosphatase family protein [Trichomonas vaginalis G3]KAI5497019.1 phosphoprotein phosphatase protein [Trichomonas vaginalis G3]|eukprot:XP_001307929.1 NLI interacting factor-like phosphatase family protein [Trichomonas vaginalis G3]
MSLAGDSSVICCSLRDLHLNVVQNALISSRSDVVNTDFRKILALDLDETLVLTSFEESSPYDFRVDISLGNTTYPVFVLKRPGVDEFLQESLDLFNVYIYTSSVIEYATAIVRELIPDFPKSKILHREHCKYMNGNFIKQLSLFGRDLSEVVTVDNNSISFCLNPNNGIIIPTWNGDEKDDKLLNVTLPLLRECYFAKDVRNPIKQFYFPKRRRGISLISHMP